MAFTRTPSPQERAERVLEQFGASWNAHVKSAMVGVIKHEIEEAVEACTDREMSVKQVAEVMGKPVRSVYDLIESAQLPAVRRPSPSGKRETVSVRARDLANYMRSGEPAADKNTSPTAARETPEAILARIQSR